MSLAGKTLFITGATRGIGLAIAKRAAGDGANVAVAAKTVDPHPKLPGTLSTAAEEIREAAKRFNVTHEGSVLDSVTLTVGVAVYPDHATEMAGLLRAADEAMYEAKHAGGDRVLVAQTASSQDPTTPSS